MAEHDDETVPNKEQLRRNAQELYDRRVLNSDEYESLLFRINQGSVGSSEDLVKAVHGIINPFFSEWSGAERKESFALAQEVLTDMDLPLVGHNGLNENDWKGEERFGRRTLTNFLELIKAEPRKDDRADEIHEG